MTSVDGDRELQRALSNRHLQLIAIGGAIGTGLFMGSGKTISLAGPSVLLVYGVIGFMLFFVMRAMGELLLSNLGYRSFRDIASDILGPWAGFFTGWTYWFCWIVTGIADIVAVAGYVAFWFPDLPRWIPAVSMILLLLALNLVTVKLFGELEFWFALVKIVAIVALIVTGVVMLAIAFQSPDGHRATLANLYNDGGVFPHGFMGFLGGFQIALFAFVGIELVGTAAAETKDPERNLPKAINSIPLRVVLFYVGALAIIMAITPWREIEPGKSPFVAMFALAGLPAAAAIINFVVLTSAASSANSGIFSTSRMLYGLGHERDAPRRFTRLSGRSVPANALVFSCACLIPGAALLYGSNSIIEAFTLVTTVSALLFMFVWSIILVSYIVYRRRRPSDHLASKFKMPGGVFMCWVVLAFFAAMLVVLALFDDTRVALLVTPIWFAILAVAWAFIQRRRTVSSL
ncbi:D-serine/D-alanine/glycine transporter [Rarobacter faecitabidus]|uniref:D-serine/D-alanine/glycine:proton symporter (AAT family) n=1 Tax=Rarobacter faecitabidus TaxID=13243 RepID=A0A542ZA15_RARFA|nr:D-serine/D-alanine/glycine transporter [Rarobacter faecitabidus]TQL57163.1 D-serine/D-alanine/glycine:proton symporter (AAT family) [Rarobacter faecitabidus]